MKMIGVDMGGKMSLDKGKRGEREVAKILQAVVDKLRHDGEQFDIQMVRNLEQTRDGGYDLNGVPWLAIEVKFQETFAIENWWKQTKKQAREGQVPVLIFRKSYQPWKVVMMGYVEIGEGVRIKTKVQISLEAFLVWFEQRLMFRSVGDE